MILRVANFRADYTQRSSGNNKYDIQTKNALLCMITIPMQVLQFSEESIDVYAIGTLYSKWNVIPSVMERMMVFVYIDQIHHNSHSTGHCANTRYFLRNEADTMSTSKPI